MHADLSDVGWIQERASGTNVLEILYTETILASIPKHL